MYVLYLYTENMQRITTQFIYRIAPIFQNLQHNSTPEMNIKMQTPCTLWWNSKHYSLISINCDCLKCHWISEHDVIFSQRVWNHNRLISKSQSTRHSQWGSRKGQWRDTTGCRELRHPLGLSVHVLTAGSWERLVLTAGSEERLVLFRLLCH